MFDAYYFEYCYYFSFVFVGFGDYCCLEFCWSAFIRSEKEVDCSDILCGIHVPVHVNPPSTHDSISNAVDLVAFHALPLS